MKPHHEDLVARAARHAALGDPVRLAIVEELALSDRSPKELATRFDLASNLLAHHVDVLAQAGLAERVVSTGDRRRRYLRLIRDAFGQLGLDAAPPAGDVLFVCSQNSARSQLAAALWTRHTGATASSAGTHPADRVHPGAVSAARRAGIDISSAKPRLLGSTADAGLVVTVCDRAHEELDVGASWWHWSIPDPVETGTSAAFDAVVDDLEARISTLV